MYEHMRKELLKIVESTVTLNSLRCGARAGLAKLDVYYDKAKLNHFYILGVGKQLSSLPVLKMTCVALFSLSPCAASRMV